MNYKRSDKEIELIEKIQQGDKSAFQQIFNAYFKMLYSYAYDLLERPYLAEDIVEDVFFKVWERRTNLNITGSLTSYLFTSVKHACLDHIKSVRVRQNYEERVKRKIQLEEMYTYHDVAVADPLKHKELKRLVKKAIQKLPRDYRKVFKMSRYYKMTNKEIAVRMGLSSHTVGKYLNLSIERLKKMLKEHVDD